MQAPRIPETAIIATGNQHKLTEFRKILGSRLHLQSLKDVGLENLQISENAKTFHGNALIKASAVYKATKLPTIADDSGICVRGLNMAPGIYSARYAGNNASDAENRKKLLEECKSLADGDLDAWFHCSLCYIDDQGIIRIFSGSLQGRVQKSETGSQGFGYDPIFYLPTRAKSMAEIPDEEKNQISHRAQATQKLLHFFGSLDSQQV